MTKEAYNEGKEGGLKNMSEVLDRIENKGVDLMAKLIDILMGENRYDDVKKATKDAAYRMQLMHQYGLK